MNVMQKEGGVCMLLLFCGPLSHGDSFLSNFPRFRKQDMVEILKDYGKAQVTAKCIARVLGVLLCCHGCAQTFIAMLLFSTGMMAGTVTGLPESTPLLVSVCVCVCVCVRYILNFAKHNKLKQATQL